MCGNLARLEELPAIVGAGKAVKAHKRHGHVRAVAVGNGHLRQWRRCISGGGAAAVTPAVMSVPALSSSLKRFYMAANAM